MMNKKRSIIGMAAILGIAGILAAGGTVAYLTDFDNSVNEFTVGKVEIDLEEPGWDPEDTKKTEPSQVISKDPKITNTGVNNAFVYLEVSVPIENVIVTDDEGNRLEKKDRELFSFQPDADWTRLEEKVVEKNKVYIFAYNNVLKKGQTTSPLFQTVTFANVVEGQLDTRQFNIPVRAYAIQSDYTGNNQGTVIDQARAAFQKYVNQNSGLESGVTK